MATLHYIYDPLCGWCYGASPLVSAAREVQGLSVVMHAGGMMAGTLRQLVSDELREFILPHVARIVALTGQPFSEAFTEGLLRDRTITLDSEPPTVAILAAQDAAGLGPQMLARIQNAQYVEGRGVFERAALAELAADVGVEPRAFDEHFTRITGSIVQAHIAGSRRLLARVGGQGFPTFALEATGKLEMLDSSRWLGKPEDWRAALESRVANLV